MEVLKRCKTEEGNVDVSHAFGLNKLKPFTISKSAAKAKISVKSASFGNAFCMAYA
jgi:hypothetical protein